MTLTSEHLAYSTFRYNTPHRRLPWAAPAVDELRLTVAKLLPLVAIAHGVTEEEVRSPSRRPAAVAARHEFFWRAARGRLSYKQLGAFLDGRDHTTVMNAVGQHCLRAGLPMPRPGADLAASVARRMSRNNDKARRRLADRMTQEGK